MFVIASVWTFRRKIQGIWWLFVYKHFVRHKSKIIETSPVDYLSNLVSSLILAWRLRSWPQSLSHQILSPAIVPPANEIQSWIRDILRSPSDKAQMEFNAFRLTSAQNVKFNFLGLIVEYACLIWGSSGRWYFKDIESIFHSCFSSWNL
jgi:hypothetical protein